ncbi:Hint domain-containing protein [Paracoccus sulfuroxidans]|uniref:Hint domain-containing protein n=1 Tax=Paracoccus sulfuroxidans TaxID=384678 RepID=A0A562NCD6_9RHOB|nr:Hint domain-containing protein [Paracoccus sulfuroxidans]TWI29852.1 Hint domain-containing protein [Paracoccus sulfuroxidans]
MPTYNVTQFYFGQYADLDPTEAGSSPNLNNDTNELTTVPGWVANKLFTSANMRLLTVTQNDTVREGNSTRLEENDFKNRVAGQGGPMGADSFTYDLGNGKITSDIDSVFTWNIEVTRGNGTTFRQVLAFVQLENGAIFSNFTPENFSGQNIQSIKLIAHSSSGFFGTLANRNLPNVKIVCFEESVRIATPSGSVAVGQLEVGDEVITKDSGVRPIRWVGRKHLGPAELRGNPQLLPVRISAGALGAGLPEADLIVSAQHRVLVTSRIASRLFSSEGVLVAAKHLLDLPGVTVEHLDQITYVHFAFDQHEIVYAEGAPAESFYPGATGLSALDDEAQAEMMALFPALARGEEEIPGARRLLTGKEGRDLARRHRKNGVSLLSLS